MFGARSLFRTFASYVGYKSGPSREDRRYDWDKDQRSPFERDRDRVLYTEHFHRLSGVTQVARTGESYIYHDRLSHSLKVAQIGRRLAEYFQRTTQPNVILDEDIPNPDVVETAALVHDMGHPPFGHTVEKELDKCIREVGVDEGFEANAQSFRIVTKAATHAESYNGLNLTRASLNAILKYPWARGENESKPNKWGYFETEKDDFEFARKEMDGKEQSLEAEIMDWADDVAYAVHDMDDFYKAGLIPLGELLSGGSERDEFIRYIEKESDFEPVEEVEVAGATYDWSPNTFFEYIGELALDELQKPYEGKPIQKERARRFTSELISRYLGYPGIDSPEETLWLGESNGRVNLQKHDLLENEIGLLTELTKYYIINNSALMAQQHGQRNVVRELFMYLFEQAIPDANYRGIIPNPYRNMIDDLGEVGTTRQRVRLVTDLITRLNEQQVLEMYERLEGTTPGSLQDRIIR